MHGLKPRQFSRSVFRAHVDELHRTGLFPAVRKAASPGLGAFLDTPGNAPAWLGGPPFDELNAVVYRLYGRSGLRALLSGSMHRGIAQILEPIFQFSLTFLGGGPGSIFGRAGTLLAVNTRGVEMTWAPAGPASGTMRVQCGEEVPPVSWIAWEGVFEYVLQLAGATGTVAEARPAADGCSCEIDVSWEQR